MFVDNEESLRVEETKNPIQKEGANPKQKSMVEVVTEMEAESNAAKLR